MGGLNQSIKSLTEKVKEDPCGGGGRGGGGQENVEFFHIPSQDEVMLVSE